MKSFNKLLITAGITSSAFGGGIVALTKDIATPPGGYDYTHRLTPAMASVDFFGPGVQVMNYLDSSYKRVSYWHAWFYGNNESSVTDTFWIPNYKEVANYYKNPASFIYFSDYANTGYVAVIEIETKNYFYFLEFNAITNTLALTYSKINNNPKFYDAIWTEEGPVNKNVSGQGYPNDELDIFTNEDKTLLTIRWLAMDPTFPIYDWTLPY